jgi:hypothetical protein
MMEELQGCAVPMLATLRRVCMGIYDKEAGRKTGRDVL